MTALARPLALVTGGAKRVGAAIVLRLIAAGYDIALHQRSSSMVPDDLALAASEAGAAISGFTADLANDAAVDALIPAVAAHFGHAPDLLVNNASLFADDDADTLTTESLRTHLTTNLEAPVRLAVAMARALGPDQRGCVVNILDQRVINPNADQLSYTLSKQALWQATRTLAVQLAPIVRVNAVAPGLTLPTPDYAAGQMERIAAAMPLELNATPYDIADAVAYLAQARAATGQTIFVDGGAHLRSYDVDFINM